MKIVRRIIGWPAMVVLTFLLFIMLILVVYAGALGRVTDVSYINGELNEVGAYSLASQWLHDNLDKLAPAVGDTETYTVFKDSLNEEWLEDQISGAMDSISD
ncbi:MAG: hypothetical protein NTU41_01750, partial [Chloroflexi bacterium]|nr:hypothetical protein [Chloroflexota bacterium]